MDDDSKQRLDPLKVSKRTKSALMAEPIHEPDDRNEWQIGEIEKAVAEADREEFANETQVSSVLRKWGVGGV